MSQGSYITAVFGSSDETFVTALWVMSTICPFIKLIHLSFHCNPAHSSQTANGTPNHVRVAAPFRLSDGLRSGEKTAGPPPQMCVVTVPVTAHCKREDRRDASSVCCCQSDVRMTKREGGGRLNRGGEGKQAGQRKQRAGTKHRNKNANKIRTRINFLSRGHH